MEGGHVWGAAFAEEVWDWHAVEWWSVQYGSGLGFERADVLDHC